MSCSPFQLDANRLNAARSTGPKSLEGKARSRINAYKHGLTGAGIALPREDAEEVQGRFEALEAELRPGSVLARILVQRAALFSIRLERCARHETVALSEKIRNAEGAFDEARASDVDQMFRHLAAEPAAVLRRLKRTPEGIERLISAWGDLRFDLIREGGGFWSGHHRERAENLTGRHCEPHRVSRIRALTAGINGDVDLLDPADLEHGDVATWCRDELARLIDAEVGRLRRDRDGLDLAAAGRDRAEAADRALFDPSAAATLARKYEAAAERGLYKALDRIEAIRDRIVAPSSLEIEVEGGHTPPAEEVPAPDEPDTPPSLPRGSSASFVPVTSKTPSPAPARSEAARKSIYRATGGYPAGPEPDPIQ